MPSRDSAPGAPRAYRSSLREEQARETRRRILDAASRTFAEKGYAGTSLADIAEGAGVSVESVKLHGPKRALLLAAFELAFAGAEGQESLAQRPEAQAVMAVEDVDGFLSGLVAFIAQANARTSGLWAAFVSAASADAHVAEVLAELLGRRRADYRRAVTLLKERGAIDAGTPTAELHRLADVLSFLMSPEGHQQLVTQNGWSVGRYTEWALGAVRRELGLPAGPA